MKSIYRREMHAFFSSATAYVLIAGFVATMGLLALFVMPNVLSQGASWFHDKELTMSSFFLAYPWVAAAVMPAVTMRSWSEEYRGTTYRLLLTLPLPLWKIVTGKYLAALNFLACMLAGTFMFPLMIAINGGWESGPILGGYLACLLLGAAYLAIGMLISALTSNQLSSYMTAFVACGTLTALGSFAGIFGSQGFFASALRYIAVGDHFGRLAMGYMRLETPLYLISLSVVCLVATTIAVERRRHL